MLDGVGARSAAMLMLFMFVMVPFVGTLSACADVPQGGERAIIDYDETITAVDYTVWDYNEDGYNESIDFYISIQCSGPSETVTLYVKLYNSTGLIKEDEVNGEATQQGSTLTWWYDASDTEYYTFNFTLYDVSHNKDEDYYQVDDVFLETPGAYYVSLEANAFDEDGDHAADDIMVHCEDPSGPLSQVEVYIDGEFLGFTDAGGDFQSLDYSEGYHMVDIFYGQFHNYTYVYTDEISSGGNMMSLTFETFDGDGDSYKDDVTITAYSDYGTPTVGAVVSIDGANVGMTGVDGTLTAYNYELGWHSVTAQRLYMNAFGEFWSEGSGGNNPYDEMFYLCEARAADADDELSLDDIAIEIDVDIPGGEGNVTTIAKLYEHASGDYIGNGSNTYHASGYDVDEEYIYFYDLPWGTYDLRYELFDEEGNIEDTRVQTIALVEGYGYINVEHLIEDLQGDTNLNDILFYAHMKDTAIEHVTIKLYDESDGLYATLETDGYGMVEEENLPVGAYTWTAFAENGTQIEQGGFRIMQRTPIGTTQLGTFSYLQDYDGDSYYDDFVLQAFNAAGGAVNTVNVAIMDMNSMPVASGYTINGQYIIENLAEGWYLFSCTSQLTGQRIATGTFYSYGQVNQNALININANVFADDGMWEDDVTLVVTNATGAPVQNAQVMLNNNYLGMTDYNGEITTYDLAQGWYQADAYFITGHAVCNFYSEGQGFVEYFYSYSIKGGVAEGDGVRNDIITKFDVDIEGDGTDLVTVIGEAFYASNNTLAKSAQISYTTTDGDWDEVYLNITNLSLEKYDVTLYLYDSHGNFMDSVTKEDVSLLPYGHEINVDTMALEMDYDYLVNDLYFFAHCAGEYSEGVTIDLYTIGGTFVGSEVTDEYGEAFFYDLANDTYYFQATSGGSIVEEGTIVIWPDSNKVRSAQLMDIDADGNYDDFMLECYDDDSGYAADFSVEVTKPDGSVISQACSGSYELENLPVGNYTYKLRIAGVGSPGFVIENCTFHSYGTPYMLYVIAQTFDDDGDTYKDDVHVHVFDSTGANIVGAEVFIDGLFVGMTDTNGNFTAYDFAYGNHDVEVHYNMSIGQTTFFSMGNGTQTGEWNFIVYLDGDNNLESAGVDDLDEMQAVGSVNGVNVLVLFDKWSTGDTRAYYVNNGSLTLIPLTTIDPTWGTELNMGDPANLVTFVNWVNDNYPAKRTLVDLWDHGGGWGGVCWDDNNGGDYITMEELNSAFTQIKAHSGENQTIIGFDACMMAMIEVDYELYGLGGYRGGSEELEPGDGWNYTALLEELTGDPSQSVDEFAGPFTYSYVDQYGWNSDATQSVTNLSRYDVLIDAVDEFSNALIGALGEYKDEIWNARNNTEYYGDWTFIDLYHFTMQILSGVPETTVQDAASALQDAIEYAISANEHGSAHPQSYGISIYYPSEEYDYDPSYEYLSFAGASQWDEFLNAFYGNLPNYDEFFKSASGQVVNLDGGAWANDLSSTVDVDVSGGFTSEVTVYVYVMDSSYNMITSTSASWTTTGTAVDPHTITLMNLQNNSYIVRYVLKDNMGNVEDTKEQTIVVGDPSNHAPVAVISSPANNSVYYTTDSIPFDGSASSDVDGDSLSYAWTSSIDGALASEAAFSLALSEGTHTITLTVTDEHGFWNSKSITVQVYASGGAMILLIDDDGTDTYERFFTDALNNTPFSYDYYSVVDSGAPTLSEMMGYQAIVWFTGDDAYTTLTTSDTANLSSYLDSGGKLFVTGQDIGYDIYTDPFYANYLHAEYKADDANLYALSGVAGDPISDGISISIQGGDGADNQDYPSEIDPINGATSVFMYNATAEGGIKVDTGTYRVVYFAFGFEAIDNPSDRATVMERVIAWLLFADNIPPVANAGPDMIVNANDDVTFVGTGSDSDGTITKYEWDFDGDGTYDWSSTTSGTATYAYLLSGSYNATLRVTDNEYGRDTDICGVIVNHIGTDPVPIISKPAESQTNTTNDIVWFDGSSSYDPDGDSFTFEWRSSIQGIIGTHSKFGTMLVEGTHTITLRVVDEHGAWAESSVHITITKGTGAPILLVDDDNGYNYQNYYMSALNSTIYNNYDVYTVKTQGPVPTSVLNSYELVIWFVGSASYDTLTTSDMANLSDFLDEGGRLFVTGQDIGYDTTVSSSTFYSDYLHATYVEDDSGIRTLDGTAGDPISDGMTIGVSGGDSPTYTRYLDVITPINGATAVFNYDATMVGGLKVDTGTYRVVYYAFSFECVNTSAKRSELMDKTLDWLLNGANMPPIAEAGPDITVNAGETATFAGRGVDPDGTIVSYAWDFEGDGTFDWMSTTTGNTTHVYNAAGVYSAIFKIVNAEGLADYDVCMVTVNQAGNVPPVADAGADATVHAGILAYLNGTGTDSDGTVVKYEWDFEGDGTFDWTSTTTGHATHTYSTTGTFNAVFRVTDDQGATGTDSVTITVVNTLPVANAGADQFATTGVEVVLAGSGTDSDGTIVKYEWDFTSDGNYEWASTTTGSVAHAYTSAGVYTATLRVTDNIGGTSTDTCVVTVTDTPNEPPIADAGPDQTAYLSGASVTVHFVGTGLDTDGTIAKYQWDFDGDGTYDWTSTTTGVVDHDYTADGVYNATLKVTDNLGAYDTDVCVVTITLIANAPPVANAGPDQTVPMGSTVYLNGSGADSDGSIVLYEWDFTNDGTYDWSSALHGRATTIYPTEGTYTAVLRVKDNNGTFDTDECVITVYHVGNYPPTAEAGMDITGYQNQAVYLNGTGTDVDGSIVKYEWDFNNDGTYDWMSTDTGYAVNNYALPGTYTAKLRVTDNNVSTATDTCIVTILPAINIPPTVNAGPDQTVYDNAILYLNGTGTDLDGTIVSWQWDINGDGIYDLTGQNVQVANPSVGVYAVKLKVTDDDGASSVDVCNVTVLHFNLPPIANAGPDMLATVGEPVTFAGTGDDPENELAMYQWDFDGNGVYEYSNTTTGTFTYTYTTAGNYTAKFKVTDGAGAYSIDTCNVSVRLPNQPPIAEAGPDKAAYTGQNVTFNGSSSYDPDIGGMIVSYEWDVDGNGIYDYVGKTINHAYASAGTYVAVLRVVDNQGASDTDTCIVTITRLNAIPIANAGLDFEVRAGEVAHLQGSAYDTDGYVVSYGWDPLGNGQFTPSASGNLTYVYASAGTYNAVLRVSDNDGGVGYDNCTVTVLPANIAPIANAGADFTVFVNTPAYFHGNGSDADGSIALFEWDFNGDGIYDQSSTHTGEAVYTYTVAGTYNASLRVTDDLGKSATDKVMVTVRPPNSPPSANAGANASVLVGTKVSFNGIAYDIDGSIVMYEWDFDGDGTWDWSSTSSGVANHTYTTIGTYVAKLRVKDNDGATTIASRTITVNPLPNVAPVVEIAYHGDAIVSKPLYLNGTATDEDGTIVKYEWDLNGDGSFEWSSTTSGVAIFTFDVPGTVVCTFRATDDDGASSTASTTVVIMPIPNAKPTIAITSPKNGTEVMGLVTITGGATDDNGVSKVEIRFDAGAFLAAQGTTNWKYDWDAKALIGSHTITARATDSAGLTSECSITITVVKAAPAEPPKVGDQGFPPSLLLILLVIVVVVGATVAYKYAGRKE